MKYIFVINRKLNLTAVRMNPNDICPKCHERTMWEGYCESCGYNESSPSGLDWGI